MATTELRTWVRPVFETSSDSCLVGTEMLVVGGLFVNCELKDGVQWFWVHVNRAARNACGEVTRMRMQTKEFENDVDDDVRGY
jgi:hypothetical protein